MRSTRYVRRKRLRFVIEVVPGLVLSLGAASVCGVQVATESRRVDGLSLVLHASAEALGALGWLSWT